MPWGLQGPHGKSRRHDYDDDPPIDDRFHCCFQRALRALLTYGKEARAGAAKQATGRKKTNKSLGPNTPSFAFFALRAGGCHEFQEVAMQILTGTLAEAVQRHLTSLSTGPKHRVRRHRDHMARRTQASRGCASKGYARQAACKQASALQA